MTWLLVVAGTLLAGLGLLSYMVSRRKQREEEEALARAKPTAEEAWAIISRPLPQGERHVRKGGFRYGMMVGAGAGLLLIAGALVLFPGQAAQPEADQLGAEPAPSAPPAVVTPPASEPPTTEPAPPAPPKPANVTFVVETGELAPDIAAKLKAARLIADEDAFLGRVAERGVDTLLKAGTFVIPTDATLDQVIDSLTA